jgi:hypothetical protein
VSSRVIRRRRRRRRRRHTIIIIIICPAVHSASAAGFTGVFHGRQTSGVLRFFFHSAWRRRWWAYTIILYAYIYIYCIIGGYELARRRLARTFGTAHTMGDRFSVPVTWWRTYITTIEVRDGWSITVDPAVGTASAEGMDGSAVIAYRRI